MRQDIEFGYYFWGAYGTILFSVCFFKKIYPKIYNRMLNNNSDDNNE